MEKITRLTLVLGLGLITSLAYGQEEKKNEELVPSKKPVELKEKPLPNIKPAEPAASEKKEEYMPAQHEKNYEEPKQPVQKMEKEQTPQESVKPVKNEKQKAETVTAKPLKAPVSPKPVEAAPEKKTPPPPAEQ